MALKRITIMLDDELLKKLRRRQAQLLMKSSVQVSLSKVINDLLRESVKK